MKLPPPFGYTFRVWLTIVLGAPILALIVIVIGEGIQGRWGTEILGKGDWILALLALILLNGLMSFPMALLFLLATYIVGQSGSAERSQKWTLLAVGVMLILLTFTLIGDNLVKLKEAFTSYAIFVFLIPLAFSVFIYPLPKQ